MAEERLTNISSEYELIKVMVDIGTSYFGEDLSTDRVGMFGFTTESAAHIFGSLLLDSSIRSKELLVSTAMKRSTLLYNAYKLGISIPSAMPTNVQAYIGIMTDSILDYGECVSTNPKTYKLVIEKDTTVTISTYTFKPEFDIEITAMYSEDSEKYIYSARYLTYGDTDVTVDDYVYPMSNYAVDISANAIPCYRTGADDKVLLIKVDLKQLKKVSYDYPITETNKILLQNIDFDFVDQLAYFNVYYKDANALSWSYIKAVPVYDKDTYLENVIYYEVLDDDKKIIFNFTGFEPTYNSQFRIELYCTKGSEANGLTYTGDGTDIRVVPTTVDDRHTYSGLKLACKPLYTDKSGSDTLSMDELRTFIMKNTPLMNAIITNEDIGAFLSNKDTINTYSVRKVRSDIVNMTYDVNMLLKTETGGIIPTRTIDVVSPLAENAIVPAGVAIPEVQNGRYCPAYDIVVSGTRVNAYASNISKRVQMTCVDTRMDSNINFRIDHVNIVKPLGSNTYKLRVSVMTDGYFDKAIDTDNGTVNKNNTKKVVMLKGYIYDDILEHIVRGIFDFNFISYSNDIFTFEADLDVIPTVTEDGKVNLTIGIVDVNDIKTGGASIDADSEFISGAGEVPSDMLIDSQNFRFGIGCYYLDYPEHAPNAQDSSFIYVNDERVKIFIDGNDNKCKSVMESVPNSSNAYPSYTGICEYTSGADNIDYILCDVYSNTTDLVNLYEDMSDIIRIDVGPTEDDISDHLLDVPCIELEVISEYDERIRNIIFNSNSLLEEVKGKLLNNFEIDYKYYNTSGASSYFKLVSTEADKSDIVLDELELTVAVSITLNENYTTLDTPKLYEIQNCIKYNIENGMVNNKISITNALTKVYNEMKKYINNIEFKSINGQTSDYRVLKYDEPVNSDSSEFISVSATDIVVDIVN